LFLDEKQLSDDEKQLVEMKFLQKIRKNNQNESRSSQRPSCENRCFTKENKCFLNSDRKRTCFDQPARPNSGSGSPAEGGRRRAEAYDPQIAQMTQIFGG